MKNRNNWTNSDRFFNKLIIIMYVENLKEKITKHSNIHTLSQNTKFICMRLVWNKGNAKRGVSPRLKIWPGDLDLWPWKSIGFQILLRTKYVPSLVKIHWRMLILVFTRMLCGKKFDPMTLKVNRVIDYLKD